MFSSNPTASQSARRVLLSACAVASALGSSSPGVAQSVENARQADDIVVTAQRSGIPVWRVNSPSGSLILVGTIRTVAKGTRWNPASLEQALIRSDRIMFPETSGFKLGLGPALSAVAKWRKQATLPKGQSLQSFLAPDQFARLQALQRRGVLKSGFERRHPYQLARSLGTATSGKLAPGADDFVRRVAKKNRIKMMPLAQVDARALLAEYFSTTPKSHVRCLMDAVALAEAGRGAVKARSDAWAARRVPAIVNSVASRMEESCFPNGTRFERDRQVGLVRFVREALSRPQVTVAVVSIDSLASSGGILDQLQSADFEVSGPKWR